MSIRGLGLIAAKVWTHSAGKIAIRDYRICIHNVVAAERCESQALQAMQQVLPQAQTKLSSNETVTENG
jgi:hypothetical protein